ncbi:hypothetical protein SAMN00808754_2062 [Thermanaeromonas toyohensis ToBE]|uniref:Uncharacterized protein n=1 Tax=Thermanaeromonas toyohensis ToBE TaxID=698762 RepID=A0A1W1VY24_9FIRM|nr:hypothetical protein [Thermanaeromonas toyohensis]SMB97991.1 hypothetical protein SAMN00808754_2062 [Thermanaeromonas toyohensis ToBE]
MKKAWRARDVGYARAAFLDAENYRRRKRKGVTKEQFRALDYY